MLWVPRRSTFDLKGVASTGSLQIFTQLHCCRKGIWQKQPKRLQRRRTAPLFWTKGGLADFFSKMWVWLHVKSIPRDRGPRNFKVVMSFIELFVWEDFPKPCRTLLPLFWPSRPDNGLLQRYWWFHIFCYFHPYVGKWSNLTNIFLMGWNNQLVIDWIVKASKVEIWHTIDTVLRVTSIHSTHKKAGFVCRKKNWRPNWKPWRQKLRRGKWCNWWSVNATNT